MFRRKKGSQPAPIEPAPVLPEVVAPKAPIRMIAIDLDGTLLDVHKRIAPETAEALKALRARDIKVVIASARPPRSVRAIYQSLELDTWQINYNGALIWDELQQKTVFHRPMPHTLVRKIIDLARDMFEEVLVSCEILDRWYTDRDDHTHTTETGRLFKPDVIAPVEEFCTIPVTKLMLLGDPRVISRLEPMLLEPFGDRVTIVRTDDNLLQIMDNRVSKAVALLKVAAHHGVQPVEIMALGDAPNDLGMLQLAGVAIAMDNAHPVVKEVAHWIAPSNNDHGVLAALQRYGLAT